MFGFVLQFPSFGQIQLDENELYQTAYNYLNDSIIKSNYVDVKTLAKNCSSCCVKGKKLKFIPDLQVACRFIENNRGFPIGDLVAKKYDFSSDCLHALRMGTRECQLANQVRDSLESFWLSYEMKPDNEIAKSLGELISNRKDGYQVFFSDIYKNTLAAEVKSFCLPYDEIMWMGSSTMFFFIFDVKGKIADIYSGRTIHYN